MIFIEAVSGDVHHQTLEEFRVEAGQTLKVVLQKIGRAEWSTGAVGIWGQLQDLDYVVKDNDRIELYRPLLIDPKAERRKRGSVESKIKKQRHKNIRGYNPPKTTSLSFPS